MANSPNIDQEKLKSFLNGDENSHFLEAFYFRTLSLLEEMEAGNIGREIVALESLLSSFSFLCEANTHEVISVAYPIQDWRDNTITVPRAWLKVIVGAWMRYKEASAGRTLGEEFNVEGGGQGKKPLKAAIDKLNRETRLSQKVMVEWLAGNAEGGLSQNKAIEIVAIKEELSTETVKNAWRARKGQIMDRLSQVGVVVPPAG